jgi:hypothetical protein
MLKKRLAAWSADNPGRPGGGLTVANVIRAVFLVWGAMGAVARTLYANLPGAEDPCHPPVL